MNEQFSPGYSGYFAGNPELAPERSHSGELGLEFAPDASQRLKANIYSTRVSNLISFSGPQNRAENVARAKVDGAELAYEVSVGMWSLHSTFTWQDPRNEDNGTLLIRRAKEKVSGVLERRFGERFSIGAELLYSSRREDVGDVNLPAYAIVNLRASYQINTNWRFGARLENIADRDYVLVHGYNTPGRSGFVDIVWQPGA